MVRGRFGKLRLCRRGVHRPRRRRPLACRSGRRGPSGRQIFFGQNRRLRTQRHRQKSQQNPNHCQAGHARRMSPAARANTAHPNLKSNVSRPRCQACGFAPSHSVLLGPFRPHSSLALPADGRGNNLAPFLAIAGIGGARLGHALRALGLSCRQIARYEVLLARRNQAVQLSRRPSPRPSRARVTLACRMSMPIRVRSARELR